MYTEFWICGILIGIAAALIFRVSLGFILLMSVDSSIDSSLSEGVLFANQIEIGGMEQESLDATRNDVTTGSRG